jgi:hypothetical protein
MHAMDDTLKEPTGHGDLTCGPWKPEEPLDPTKYKSLGSHGRGAVGGGQLRSPNATVATQGSNRVTFTSPAAEGNLGKGPKGGGDNNPGIPGGRGT